MIESLRAIFLIIRRSLRHHLFSTLVTVVAAGLASGLVMSVFSVQEQARLAFSGGRVGFDAVLGARGSQLQLVLNTVFHLETSPGNIPWSMYEEMRQDSRVALAVPYATGDNFAGFRIVGTTGELFSDFEYTRGKGFRCAEGRFFDEGFAEAVLGSTVAATTGLRVGDVFRPAHGVVVHAGHTHEVVYTVVGILEPTNSPSDRVVWIPIEGIYRMDGHVLRGAGEDYHPHPGEEIADEHKEVSAVMLVLANPQFGFDLAMTINGERDDATLAYPIGKIMADLFDRLGWIHRVFEVVAYLVVAVSGAATLASLYNTINERRREFAILRALGARRSTVFASIVGEAVFIGAAGSVVGIGVCVGALMIAARIVRQQTGVILDAFAFHPVYVWAPLGMVALGAVAGTIPAIKAYATDPGRHLAGR